MVIKFRSPEKIWRWLVNVWMMVTCGVVLLDFFYFGKFGFLLSPLTIIYISLLSVYVTSKEFGRWFLCYRGRHPGELGVLLWTGLMILMLALNAWLGEKYHISQEVITAYLTVVGIFVISRGSKALYSRRSRP